MKAGKPDWARSSVVLHSSDRRRRSRDARLGVGGLGPQVGFFIPVGSQEVYLNVRGYYEFDARNRLEGWTAYVTLSMEAPELKAASGVRKR